MDVRDAGDGGVIHWGTSDGLGKGDSDGIDGVVGMLLGKSKSSQRSCSKERCFREKKVVIWRIQGVEVRWKTPEEMEKL